MRRAGRPVDFVSALFCKRGGLRRARIHVRRRHFPRRENHPSGRNESAPGWRRFPIVPAQLWLFSLATGLPAALII